MPAGLPTSGDPLAVLGAAWRALKAPRLPGLPPLTGGFVGYLAYDVVRWIETAAAEGGRRTRPARAADAARHRSGRGRPSRMHGRAHRERARPPDAERGRTRRGLRRRGRPPRRDAGRPGRAGQLDGRQLVGRRRRRRRRRALRPGSTSPRSSRRSRRSGPARCSRSRSASGSACRPPARPLDVYRVLRTLNPSPYMYFLRLPDVDIVGCSPEALVTVSARPGRAAPDRRHPPPGRHRRAGRGAGGRVGARSEGAGRARHAGRPGPQRPRPGLDAGHGRGGRVRCGRALQPRLAHRVDRAGRGRRRARTPSTCSPRASRPAR